MTRTASSALLDFENRNTATTSTPMVRNTNLSDFDLRLSPSDQAQIRHAKEMWYSATTDAERQGWHNYAEEIRRKQGFSGGVAGDEYWHVNTFNPPELPRIDPYYSQYDGQLRGVMDEIRNAGPYRSEYQDRIDRMLNSLENQPDYESPYEKMIKETLGNIMNRPDFKYDPDKDPAYQAFKKRTLQQGDDQAENVLVGLSANTMGRKNSWATSMSAKAKMNSRLQAEAGMAGYEDRAFNRYQIEGQVNYNKLSALQNLDALEFSKYQSKYNNQLNLLGAIQNLDAQKYQQYRDTITDKKELANFIMQLDNRDYQKYQFMVENQWRTYQAEFSNYQAELKFHQQEFENALNRTNLQGFVNNQDSFILGVPTGTLSSEARQRQNKIQDFLTQSDYRLQQEFKLMQQDYEFNKSLQALAQRGELDAINLQGGFNLNQARLDQSTASMINGLKYGSVHSGAVKSASKYIGVPYVWGGTSKSGTDCSGMIQQAYQDMGYSFSKRLTSQGLRDNPKSYGFVEIPLSEAKPGDILWNKGHVAMLYDKNNVIEASRGKGKTVVQTAWNRKTQFQKAYRHM